MPPLQKKKSGASHQALQMPFGNTGLQLYPNAFRKYFICPTQFIKYYLKYFWPFDFYFPGKIFIKRLLTLLQNHKKKIYSDQLFLF